MHKHKAIEALKTFTPDEFKRFEKFIKSPYFNTAKDTVKLFDIIKTFYPAFDSPALKIERVSKKLKTKGLPTKEARIRNILTALFQLTKKFLSTEFYTTSEHYMEFAAVRVLYNKKLTYAYKKEVSNYFEKYKDIQSPSDFHMYEIFQNANLYLMDLENKARPYKDPAMFSFQSEVAALIALDIIITNAKVAPLAKFTFNLQYPDICGEIFKLFDFEKFIERSKKISPKVYDIINPEYYLMKISMNKDFEDSYKKLTDNFLKRKNHRFTTYTTIFTINSINTIVNLARYNTPYDKAPAVAKKAIPLMEFFLKNKLYKNIAPDLPLINFIGFLNNASLAKDYDWMKQFIENYSGELNIHDKDFTVSLGLGMYNTHTGKFREALSLLSKLSGGSTFLVNFARFHMILCHYGLGNYETALSMADAYVKFLERKYETSERPDIIEMKFFKKFLKIVQGNSLSGLRDLEGEVKRTLKGSSYILNYINKLKQK